MYYSGRLEAGSAGPTGAAANSPCQNCPVKGLAVCAGLAACDRENMGRAARHRYLKKGQALVWEGDDMPFVASVVRGRLTLSRNARDGGELILGSVGPGGFVGDMVQPCSTNNIVAVSETELCVYSKTEFNRLASQHPEIHAQLVRTIFQDLEQTRSWLFMVGRGTASERVASVLMEFAEEADEGSTDIRIDRTQIAFSAGVAMETVSRHLTRFVRAGIIALPSRDRFELIDPDALAAVAGHGHARELH